MLVSAFAANSRLCLGACAVQPGKGEVDAALHMVALLDLTGRIVTSDALHCTHEMARAICARGGDYVLTLKGNRPDWLDQAKQHFNGAGVQSARVRLAEHGRTLHYHCATVLAAKALTKGHAAFGRVTCHRGAAAPQTRYFLMSLPLDPQQLLHISKSHWAIENNLHWVLDVHLNEDSNRARKDHAPANAGILNRIARNILQLIDKPKIPISHRMKKCAWDENYLLNAMAHMR